MILQAGRATLELANPAQRQMIDQIETAPSWIPPSAWPSRVDDTSSTVATLLAAGATAVAPPVQTPWRSLNARLAAPADLQVTVFQGIESREDRAGRPHFGTTEADHHT